VRRARQRGSWGGAGREHRQAARQELARVVDAEEQKPLGASIDAGR
jgi:hypothetical protein